MSFSSTYDLFASQPMSQTSVNRMAQSPPSRVTTGPETGTSVQARVMRFLHGRHPAGMAKRVSADTMRATGGAGVPVATIQQWEKRGSAPSADHLDVLGATYGLDFVAAVFARVPGLALAAQQARTDALAEQIRASEAETARLRQIARGA